MLPVQCIFGQPNKRIEFIASLVNMDSCIRVRWLYLATLLFYEKQLNKRKASESLEVALITGWNYI
jgi:hypothetical protein